MAVSGAIMRVYNHQLQAAVKPTAKLIATAHKRRKRYYFLNACDVTIVRAAKSALNHGLLPSFCAH